jgi:hypothetical protein
MRKLYPKLFKVRSWVPEMNCELAKKSFGWLDWGVFSVNDDDMMEHCGLDSICFLRALRLGRKLALAGSVNALWLIPLYYTAKTDESTQFLIDRKLLRSLATNLLSPTCNIVSLPSLLILLGLLVCANSTCAHIDCASSKQFEKISRNGSCCVYSFSLRDVAHIS